MRGCAAGKKKYSTQPSRQREKGWHLLHIEHTVSWKHIIQSERSQHEAAPSLPQRA